MLNSGHYVATQYNVCNRHALHSMKTIETDKQPNFLPDFCSARVLFVVVLSAELLAIVLTLNRSIYVGEILFELALNSLFIQWIALSCVGLLCVFKRHLNRLPVIQASAISYLIILLVSLLIVELAWWSLYVYPLNARMISSAHGWFILRAIGVTAIIGAVVLRYLYLQHEWRSNIETLVTSRLQALQSRIRPHFLFNCMNTIAGLTRKSPELAEQSVEDLAELFRASLIEPTNLYRISEEWNLCRLYLRIEKHRLGERLNIDWQIDTIPDTVKIPPLTIQPLLENSIYHGIERLAEGGCIHIQSSHDEHRLCITVTNPIPAINDEDSHKGNKLALENIRQRLQNLFAEDSDLIIEADAEQFRVMVVLPMQTL